MPTQDMNDSDGLLKDTSITCTCPMSRFSPESYSSLDKQDHLCGGLITPSITQGEGERGRNGIRSRAVGEVVTQTSTSNVATLL